jgi:hypothetical protein
LEEFTFFSNGNYSETADYGNYNYPFYVKQNVMSNSPFEYEIKIPTENITGLLSAAPDNTYFDPYSCVYTRKQYDKWYCFPPRIKDYIINYHTLNTDFSRNRGSENGNTLLFQNLDSPLRKSCYSLINKKYWKNQFFKVSTNNLNYLSQKYR